MLTAPTAPFVTPKPGLAAAEVEERRKTSGYNELPSSKPKSVWRIVLDVLKEPMLLLLLSWPLQAAEFTPVTPGTALQFPRDFGSHPGFKTEWWYATGWLTTPDGRQLGYQVTFFRSGTGHGRRNPSAFAPRDVIVAHVALSDPAQAVGLVPVGPLPAGSYLTGPGLEPPGSDKPRVPVAGRGRHAVQIAVAGAGAVHGGVLVRVHQSSSFGAVTPR